MTKLPCGCIPDGSGYGYCGECTRKLKEKIWKNMSEKRKKYDRHFDSVQSQALDDAMDRYDRSEGCSCHINPPCNYCVSNNEED